MDSLFPTCNWAIWYGKTASVRSAPPGVASVFIVHLDGRKVSHLVPPPTPAPSKQIKKDRVHSGRIDLWVRGVHFDSQQCKPPGWEASPQRGRRLHKLLLFRDEDDDDDDCGNDGDGDEEEDCQQ